MNDLNKMSRGIRKIALGVIIPANIFCFYYFGLAQMFTTSLEVFTTETSRTIMFSIGILIQYALVCQTIILITNVFVKRKIRVYVNKIIILSVKEAARYSLCMGILFGVSTMIIKTPEYSLLVGVMIASSMGIMLSLLYTLIGISKMRDIKKNITCPS